MPRDTAAPHPIRTHKSRVGGRGPEEKQQPRVGGARHFRQPPPVRAVGNSGLGRGIATAPSCSRAKLREEAAAPRGLRPPRPPPPLPYLPCARPSPTLSRRTPSSRASKMASRDKVGCSPAALPLDRVLAALATNAEQLGRRWEAAVRGRCGMGDGAAVGKVEGKGQVIEMHTPLFYATCALGGILSTGLTHLAVTPLDLVKCNMQVDPSRYRDISSGFGVLLQEQGIGGFFKGWMATLVGYSCQGACKFGFYEFFKKCYSDIAGLENAERLKTLIYLAASASAEVIADVALCPMEAVKIRVQTQPGFARCLTDGLPKIVQSEGAFGLYKGLIPLWGRQVPYTMMKFACFETIVEMVYKHALPKPKDQCSKPLQLAVSFVGGYIAGVFCASISHPADNLVSFLNNAKGATVADAVRTLGMWGLFTRGLPLRIIMVGTLTGAQWATYDAFKVFVGLPTSGGVSPSCAAASPLHQVVHEKQN